MHMSPIQVVYTVAILGLGTVAHAQQLPTSQPKYLRIIREEVKFGRGTDHAKIEAGWPAAFERAKSPDFYLAMESMTGASEAWFIIPEESNAAAEATMKRDMADKQLSAEFDRLTKLDAEFVTNVTTVLTAARPDLSFGTYPDLSRQRFWQISWFRVRPGHQQQFEAAAKTYTAVSKRVAPNAAFRVYEVIAGLPGPTFLIFSSLGSYAEFDAVAIDGQKTWSGMTPEELSVMNKFSTDGMVNIETHRFRLSPTMSYVPRSVRLSDPAFWMPGKQSATAGPNAPVAQR
ncbi:MAG: hypothetical protein NVS1B5_15190 [Gemmatimonadaceae bacterium]